jgi:DNA-binding response OmpR family regulator
MHLLVAEDEVKLASLLKRGLEEENHRVLLARDGAEAVELAACESFDLIILDVMLPKLDGYEVARRLRRKEVRTPILMLTARDAVPDIISGLDAGADDYLTKPFAFGELLARIRALGRRGPAVLPNVLSIGDLSLDPASQRVARGNRDIPLTATEYRLLELLMRNAGRVVLRSAILNAVWGFDKDVEENTLDAFVSSLRSKVTKGAEPQLIHTARGRGYCVRDES